MSSILIQQFAIDSAWVAGTIYGLPLVFFVVMAIRQYPISRAIHRIKRGQCAACGYDLRGSTQSDTCPECGESITRRLPGWYVKRLERERRGPSMPDWWLKKPR